MDELYNSIKNNGYKTFLDDEWTSTIRGVPKPDAPRLAVNRNGEFIHLDGGKHRICMAKVLNLDTIPAVVQIEHEKFEGSLDIVDKISLEQEKPKRSNKHKTFNSNLMIL